jgi:hypothetical protein
MEDQMTGLKTILIALPLALLAAPAIAFDVILTPQIVEAISVPADTGRDVAIQLPGGSSDADSGGGLKPGMLETGRRNKVDPVAVVPGTGKGDVPVVVGDPTGRTTIGDIKLHCEIKADGDLVLVNAGDETLPRGSKVRWKAGRDQGFLAVNRDILPGGQATKSGDIKLHAPCLAVAMR